MPARHDDRGVGFTTSPFITEAAKRLVERSTAAQDLPAAVTDETVLQSIAALIASAPCSSSVHAHQSRDHRDADSTSDTVR